VPLSARVPSAAAVLLLAMALAACATPPAPPPADAAPAIPLAPDPGPAATRPLDAAFAVLAEESRTGWLRVLVELREQVDLGALIVRHQRTGLPRSEAAAASRAALIEVAERGAERLTPLLEELAAQDLVEYHVPLRFRSRFFVSLRPEAFEPLRNHPAVAAILPEYDSVREARRAAGSGGLGAPVPEGDSWGVELLGLRELWNEGIDGRGVLVALLDTGVIGHHEAFAAGRHAGTSWYDPVGGQPDPIDSGPHGSQVLGCAVAREVGGRAIGTAPGARWAAALSNQHNSYNNVNMSLAADWLIFEVRPDVVLGAWGHGASSCDPRDRTMIEAFRATGTVPVLAAGNDGPEPGTIQAPAALRGYAGEGPLVVAAVDRHLEVIDASSRGPSGCEPPGRVPDVAAPGWKVPVPGAGRPDALQLASGTSMAVGWVGGVVALMLQVQPELPVPVVEDLVRHTARDLPPEGVDPASGYGLIDPRAAVDAAMSHTHDP
jgi:subtilisin family serine protease